MKPQDILVLLKIFLKSPGHWTIARLAHELFISKSEIHAAIKRLKASGLARDSINFNCCIPNIVAMKEFLVHGLKYSFPAKEGKEMRGLPTSHSAPPLAELIISNKKDVYVWPYEFGKIRGKSILPLYHSVPKAVESDDELYALLVLIDGIRIGRARELGASENELIKRLDAGSERFSHAI